MLDVLLLNYRVEEIVSGLEMRTKFRDLSRRMIIKHINEKTEFKLSEQDIVSKKSGKVVLDQKININISISYTTDWIVCCISDSKVGIDVEKIIEVDYKRMSNYFFTENENKYISEESINSTILFYKFWTLKEAFLKHEEIIKLVDFCDIEFNICSSRISCRYLLKNIPHNFWNINYGGELIISVCSQAGSEPIIYEMKSITYKDDIVLIYEKDQYGGDYC